MDTIERQRILTQMTLFEALPSEALAAIAEEMKYRQYYRGEVIVWQGNPSNILYVLTNGIAAVRSQLPGQTSQQTLAYLMPGNSFGEVGILESQPRSASVVALTDVEVLVLHRDAFLGILHHHSSVAIELARGLARALVEANRRQALSARKANIILVVRTGAECGQTQVGHAVSAMLAFKSKQPTVYTEYPDVAKLRADFELPESSHSHTLPLGHVLSTPAPEPGELGPARAHFRMHQLLTSYDNIVVGLTDIEREGSLPFLEYANQILLVTRPGPEALADVEHISQHIRQHTPAHKTGLLVVGNRPLAEHSTLDFHGAFDFTLPFIAGIPELDQSDSVDYSVPKPGRPGERESVSGARVRLAGGYERVSRSGDRVHEDPQE